MESIIKNKGAKTFGKSLGIEEVRENEIVMMVKGAALDIAIAGESAPEVIHELMGKGVIKNATEALFVCYMVGGIAALSNIKSMVEDAGKSMSEQEKLKAKKTDGVVN